VRELSYFYRYGGSRGRQGRVFVSAVAGLDLEAQARFAVRNVKRLRRSERVWKMRAPKKTHSTVARARLAV